ncbi:hypothetical protein GpartN1_g3826.t1 [Galdieria partita]|uniref:protein-tyrosine-phosphatase n=1 Tax=Galdieria partita TaxID=83374 RepID=A0A9C7PX45_9RHOD|nr:hypothetical protein GpartN1_g3826.t1 [Galdieria partita]
MNSRYTSILYICIRSFLWHLIKNFALLRKRVSSLDKTNHVASSVTEHHENASCISKIRPQFERLPLEVISCNNTSIIIQNIEFALITRTKAKPLIEVQTDLAGNVPSTQTDKDSIFYISARTAAETILNKSASVLNIIIIDCRFPYEYEGGHIRDAYNCYIPKQIQDLLCPSGWETQPVADAIIFYCEYSSHRAPKMSQYLRSLDRNVHFDSYPILSYPHLYVISKGYREFYVNFPELCVPPGGYTPMRPKKKQNITRKYSIQLQHPSRQKNGDKHAKPRSSLSLEALLSPRTNV